MMTKEEIKEEIMEMFYGIITGDAPDSLGVKEKMEAYWNNFLIEINKGFRFMTEGDVISDDEFELQMKGVDEE